jgi:hypothetical protein
MPDACGDFVRFIEREVLPFMASHPGWQRFDGKATGSTWEVAGTFDFQKRTWTVHQDTSFEPLLVAYWAAVRNNRDPFHVKETPKGRLSLELADELRSRTSSPSKKHMYIYADQ